MLPLLKRAWVPLAVAAAVALGGIAVDQLRGAFGSEEIFSMSGQIAEPLTQTAVKEVTYEIFGPPGAAGTVSYLDPEARSQRTRFTSLPWTYTIATTVPAVIAHVVAQGNAEQIGCRIIVNGEVKDERVASGDRAQTACLVKAA